jgi:hypothetical protein
LTLTFIFLLLNSSVPLISHLHELHEPALQEEQLDDVCLSAPLIPKTENFLITSAELHEGQETELFPKTIISKSAPQAEHLYSNIGISHPFLFLLMQLPGLNVLVVFAFRPLA